MTSAVSKNSIAGLPPRTVTNPWMLGAGHSFHTGIPVMSGLKITLNHGPIKLTPPTSASSAVPAEAPKQHAPLFLEQEQKGYEHKQVKFDGAECQDESGGKVPAAPGQQHKSADQRQQQRDIGAAIDIKEHGDRKCREDCKVGAFPRESNHEPEKAAYGESR